MLLTCRRCCLHPPCPRSSGVLCPACHSWTRWPQTWQAQSSHTGPGHQSCTARGDGWMGGGREREKALQGSRYGDHWATLRHVALAGSELSCSSHERCQQQCSHAMITMIVAACPQCYGSRLVLPPSRSLVHTPHLPPCTVDTALLV
jgi:hypothetical protein